MTSQKHFKTAKPSDADLKRDPGIGRTAGTRSPEDNELLAGRNTIEGDAGNDTTPQGGVDPDDLGRTNK